MCDLRIVLVMRFSLFVVFNHIQIVKINEKRKRKEKEQRTLWIM